MKIKKINKVFTIQSVNRPKIDHVTLIIVKRLEVIDSLVQA